MPSGAEVDLGGGIIVVEGDPAPPRKGALGAPPHFWALIYVAKRSPISATAELLFYQVIINASSLMIVFQ